MGSHCAKESRGLSGYFYQYDIISMIIVNQQLLYFYNLKCPLTVCVKKLSNYNWDKMGQNGKC